MRNARKLSLFMAIVVGAWAQSQVATVTSSGPFQLRGASVTPGQGVPSWPAMPGDEIKAESTPVTVTFADGSAIILAPGSSAKIDMSGQTPIFQLLSGSTQYSLKTISAVKLLEINKVVTPAGMTGVLQIGTNAKGAGWWTTGHTVAVVGGSAGAAGLGYGIERAVSGGAAVSPSR